MTPTSLTCEYLRNPLGIDVVQPRLSWTIKSDRRGETQTAYHILVASSEELLHSDKGDLWDSGKVASDQSVLVEYAGKPLASEARCYWKVRVWDHNGKPSAWSETALWTMGLLHKSDWKGKWIAYRANLEPDETAPPTVRSHGEHSASIHTQKVAGPLFRKEFTASKPIKRATVHICGLGFYELSINGEKAGDEVMNPAFTRYDKRSLYVTHDVTSLMKQGENAIGVMLGNGFYNCQASDAWDFERFVWRNTPRLLMQMKVEYADGSSEVIVSDSSWKTTTGPLIFDYIRNGENYDARLEKTGWNTAGYSEHPELVEGRSDWQPVVLVDGPTDKLVAQKIVPAKVTETLKPVKITEPKPGIFVFDMGRNISGWCRLKVAGPVGTTITIRYDERLHEDGTLYQMNSTHVFTGEFQTDKYTLKGVGIETWEPRFVYHGFQYAQVEGFPGKPTLDSLELRIVHAAFEEMGEFECSNDLLNTIHKFAQRSYKSNFISYPTDCPHREKNGWTGDAQLACETGLYNFNSESNYTKWIDDFDDCQRPDGNLPGIIPTDTWGYDWGNGPAYDSAYMLIPWYVRLYRGDTRLLMAHYEGYKRYLDYVANHSEGHIAGFGLGDWCPPVGSPESHPAPRELTSTAYYYVDVKIVAEVAGMLGKIDEQRKYEALAEEIKKTFIERFYDSETGTYIGKDQTGMAAALYQGLVPDSEKSKVMEALVAEVANRKGHVFAGILGTKYLLHALTDNGRADLAYEAVSKRDFPSWGHWIEMGATSLWEKWDGGDSRNHIMFGDIDAWFYETLAGINPDPAKIGFKNTIIRPRPVGDLKWAKAWHRSPYGVIRSSWKREPKHPEPVEGRSASDKFILDLEIPANSTATVYIPAASVDQVTEGGKPASKSEGVKFARMDDGCVVFQIGSGSYKFRVGE